MKIRSFVMSISSDGNGEIARTIPVSINPTVYGIFSRRAVIATIAAIRRKVAMYSMLIFIWINAVIEAGRENHFAEIQHFSAAKMEHTT